MQPIPKKFGQYWPIILLVLINILIGLLVVRDYGQSWDEPGIQRYAEQALSAYVKFIKGEPPPVYQIDLMYYGPAFGMLGALMVRALESSGLGWLLADYWHLILFLSFQVGVISLYSLSRRWMSRWAAFGVALLFTTQPLIWGHAFINPKDIPFMAFFLMSITLGFAMVDKGVESRLPMDGLYQPAISMSELMAEWGSSKPIRKWTAIAGAALWVSAGVFLMFFEKVINGFVAILVAAAYAAGGQGFLGNIFTRLAPNATQIPVENYISKTQAMFMRWEGLFYIILGLALALVLLRLATPVSYRSLVDRGITPAFRVCLFFLKRPYVYWAAIVLGLTISIRVLGPYAGILVGLFAIWKTGKRSLFFLLPYFGLALLISYLTWPFLWRDPIGRFCESIQVMSRFVQQDAALGSSTNSPLLALFSLPRLMAFQLTESLLIVFMAGLILALFHSKNRNYLEPLLLWILWFLVPIAWMVVSNSTIYDNFRQLLFVLPPLFLMGGLALEWLFTRFNKIWLNGIVISLLALPGVYACIQLHPYEYIYYNTLAGGVKGVFRNHELDYWATSYKEAAEYLNDVAPADAKIGVTGTDLIFTPYVRPDLNITYFNGVDVGDGLDYAVISSRGNNDLAVCPRAKIVKTIERDGAILASIKQITSPEDCVLSP